MVSVPDPLLPPPSPAISETQQINMLSYPNNGSHAISEPWQSRKLIYPKDKGTTTTAMCQRPFVTGSRLIAADKAPFHQQQLSECHLLSKSDDDITENSDIVNSMASLDGSSIVSTDALPSDHPSHGGCCHPGPGIEEVKQQLDDDFYISDPDSFDIYRNHHSRFKRRRYNRRSSVRTRFSLEEAAILWTRAHKE